MLVAVITGIEADCWIIFFNDEMSLETLDGPLQNTSVERNTTVHLRNTGISDNQPMKLRRPVATKREPTEALFESIAAQAVSDTI